MNIEIEPEIAQNFIKAAENITLQHLEFNRMKSEVKATGNKSIFQAISTLIPTLVQILDKSKMKRSRPKIHPDLQENSIKEDEKVYSFSIERLKISIQDFKDTNNNAEQSDIIEYIYESIENEKDFTVKKKLYQMLIDEDVQYPVSSNDYLTKNIKLYKLLTSEDEQDIYLANIKKHLDYLNDQPLLQEEKIKSLKELHGITLAD